MPFKTFAIGDVLTDTDLNTYLMRQSVVKCTSGSRPSSPSEGDVIYETDTDKLLIHNGSTWVTQLHVGAGKVGTYRVDQSIRTSDSAQFSTTETAIDSVSAALVSGRTYLVRWTVAWSSTVAGDTVFTRLREDTVAGTQLQIHRIEVGATGGTGTRWPATIEAEYTAASTANKIFVGTGVRATGTGNIHAHSTAESPIRMTVDYIRG